MRAVEGEICHAVPSAGGGWEKLEGSWEEGWKRSGCSVEPAQWLPPVNPTAIFGVGLNYRRHAEETGARLPGLPVLFFKNPASATGHRSAIRIPARLPSRQVDYECELAVVIGKPCLNATQKNALDFVMGYTCANDVSARDWQKHGGARQWCRGKSFDTFCPLGPCLATPEDIPDPGNLRLRTLVNGEILQASTTADMIFSVPRLIEFLSASTTLLPGTVILTGTPDGVGMARRPPRWLQPGDTVAVEIEGIGLLENFVVEEEGVEPLAAPPED